MEIKEASTRLRKRRPCPQFVPEQDRPRLRFVPAHPRRWTPLRPKWRWTKIPRLHRRWLNGRTQRSRRLTGSFWLMVPARMPIFDLAPDLALAPVTELLQVEWKAPRRFPTRPLRHRLRDFPRHRERLRIGLIRATWRQPHHRYRPRPHPHCQAYRPAGRWKTQGVAATA